MLHSICIVADVPAGATSFKGAPIEDVTGGRVWLLVDDDECYWEPTIIDSFIDGEEGGVPFASPTQVLEGCKGSWFGYEILNAEDCYADREGFI